MIHVAFACIPKVKFQFLEIEFTFDTPYIFRNILCEINANECFVFIMEVVAYYTIYLLRRE